MLSNKELVFITEFLEAYELEDVEKAAKCALIALSSKIERGMVSAMVSLVNNMVHDMHSSPTSVTALLCQAADAGFHEYAYNAANAIMDKAKGITDYKVAEHYFKIAIAFDKYPNLQAAAYVNYCAIVRDGLISRVPDWPAAIELYETAARMGLVKAMFNAANVSSWLAYRGDRAYGARAAYWYTYALDHRAAAKPTLDIESSTELEKIFEQCMLGLSAFHIDSLFEGANREVGIHWARELANRGNDLARDHLKVGYGHRLAELAAQPQSSPGANWRAVLAQMDWNFKGELVTHANSTSSDSGERIASGVDKLSVKLEDKSEIALYVTHEPCLPLLGGFKSLNRIAIELISLNPDGFLLLTRKALFLEENDRSYTPIYVFHKGQFTAQALWMGCTPTQILQQAEQRVEFCDKRFGNKTCMIPIAVNDLDEGFVVATDAVYDQPWISVGGHWRMPFLDKNKLSKLGLIFEE